MNNDLTENLIACQDTALELNAPMHTIMLGCLPSAQNRSLFSKPTANVPAITFEANLHFENIRGTGVAPMIDAYLGLPDNEIVNDEHYVGSLGLYGLAEGSENDRSGLHCILNISKLLYELCTRQNQALTQLKIVLELVTPMPADASVNIGKVSLYLIDL